MVVVASDHRLWTVIGLVLCTVVGSFVTGCDECVDGSTRVCACPSGNGVLRCNQGTWRSCDCNDLGGIGRTPGSPPPPPTTTTCGDGVCDGFDEDADTCPSDCGCGDRVCTAFDRTSCPSDCSRECLRRECGPLDDSFTCPDVCVASACGDGFCAAPENVLSCPSDCAHDGGFDAGICAGDAGCDAGPACDVDGGCEDAGPNDAGRRTVDAS